MNVREIVISHIPTVTVVPAILSGKPAIAAEVAAMTKSNISSTQENKTAENI